MEQYLNGLQRHQQGGAERAGISTRYTELLAELWIKGLRDDAGR
jgi:hypothetical protein